MAGVRFAHPRLSPDLVVDVNPDQVTWAYGLNTAVYPTYGGEVVQILSVYFDDMTIMGTVSTYAELERIYTWFIQYMQWATQGVSGQAKYDQVPVSFHYEERGWEFQIWPKALPGFKYGTDVVAPTWSLTAAVKEPDATFADQLKTYAAFVGAHKGEVTGFGTATADFGTTGDLVNNPWASPDADPSRRKGQTVQDFTAQRTTQLADQFVGFLGDYNSQDLAKLPQFHRISKPNLNPPAASGKKGAKVKAKAKP